MTTASLDVKIWKQRWQGVKDQLNYWLEHYERNSEKYERQSTLMAVLAGLEAFGDSQMDFFLKGLDPDANYNLEPSGVLPWEHVLRTTLTQIQHDLDVLLRACAQRQRGLTPDPMRTTLELADKLAYRALKPAIDQKLVDADTTVITYFQKSVNIRLIPYAPIALVGIPFSAIQARRDLLAIPHEVGHYVFRDGRVRNGRFMDSRFSVALYSQFADQPTWAIPWLEEIFADMYGMLVAGPVMGLSFHEMAQEATRAEFLEDDGEHPVWALRSAIYTTTLKKSGQLAAGEALEKSWQDYLAQQRGGPTNFTLSPGRETVALADAIADLENKVVPVLLQEQFLGKLASGNTSLFWGRSLAKGEAIPTLYDAFERYIADVQQRNEPLPKLKWSLDDPEYMIGTRKHKVGTTGLWIDSFKEMARRAQLQDGLPLNVPPDVWALVLDGGGWTTEGPGGGPLH